MTTNFSTAHLPSLVQSYIPTSLQPFILLSYPILSLRRHPRYLSFLQRDHSALSQTLYGKGPKDVYFVAFCAVGFTVLRQVSMSYVFQSFASWELDRQHTGKHGKEAVMSKREQKQRDHAILRFSEQAWSCLYCTIFWTLGLITLYQNPSPTSPEQLWGTYPYTPISGLTKFYYLAQLGWWFHQIYVINTEKRRKDHYQMFGHHILTIALMVSSYLANFTRVGVLIHFLMDLCDIWLPLAKMFRYMGYTQLCDATFVLFLVSWLATRQIGLFLVIHSTYAQAPKYIPFKWSPIEHRYLSHRSYWIFISMLTVLLILCSIWLMMALNVAIRVVRGLGAEDSRSDDEDEGSPTPSPTISQMEDIPQLHGASTATTMNGHSDQELKKRR